MPRYVGTHSHVCQRVAEKYEIAKTYFTDSVELEAVGRETPGSQEFFRHVEVLMPSTPMVVCNLTRPGLDSFVEGGGGGGGEEGEYSGGSGTRTSVAYRLVTTPAHSANTKWFVLRLPHP